MNAVYLSLGANLGNRAASIAKAIALLDVQGIYVFRRSSLYETEPVSFLEQPWFLNCVAEVETNLVPRELIRAVLEVERELGRCRQAPQGPREIDIDILLYGSQIVHAAGLEIPHPRMADRRFVLVPLVELAPEIQHPVLNRSARELLAGTLDRSQVRLWGGAARVD